MAVFSISIKFNHTHSIVLMAIMGQNPKMCRKSRKLAWGTEPSTIDQLKETFDYKFLELLVLCESKSDVSDRLKKTRRTIQSNDQQFLDELKPFLRTPDKYIAKRVRDAFYPNLKEEPPRSKSAPFQAYEQRIPLSMRKTVHPRVKSAPPLPESESWTMVTPVPHLSCHCGPQRSYTPIITKEDLDIMERKKIDLYFKIHTSNPRCKESAPEKKSPKALTDLKACQHLVKGYLPSLLVTLQLVMRMNRV
ncbi:uncharacterized protein LOC100558787 isoform X3 [Anolis carolinensis]|uniref:uncharacterized protein LOC100558787 isoform X3 n=1 Tax=Anolis carolinensis TaxID=28377 RepID=UPI002F2B27CC